MVSVKCPFRKFYGGFVNTCILSSIYNNILHLNSYIAKIFLSISIEHEWNFLHFLLFLHDEHYSASCKGLLQFILNFLALLNHSQWIIFPDYYFTIFLIHSHTLPRQKQMQCMINFVTVHFNACRFPVYGF